MSRSRPRDQLLASFRERFERHPHRHVGIAWPEVLRRLESSASALASLDAMTASGGEPDVVGRDAGTGEILLCDCAAESPAGRRSLCYDEEALRARKEAKPAGSAVASARAMGVELLTEAEYRALQQLEPFDTKTSSWLATPPEMRALGGALFGDRRYERVFVYHNGAQSYYAARGFRGLLRL